MLTRKQKIIVRKAYAEAMSKTYASFEADTLIGDIYVGGEDPGQWGNDDTVVTILTEMHGYPSPLDEFFIGGKTHFCSEDWFKIDEYVCSSTGLNVFSEPVNYAVVNVWEA